MPDNEPSTLPENGELSAVDLLRFTTAGSVDDGKSTLIGRLLYDSKNIFEDQLEVLQKIAGDIGLSQAEGRTSVHRPRHRRIRYGTGET